MAERVERFQFDSAEFDRLFVQFVADLEREYFNSLAIAPLPFFHSEVVPIRLDEDLEIDRLTDAEVIRCLSFSVPAGMDLGGIVHMPQRCGIRLHFAEPKRVGSSQMLAGELDSLVERSKERPDRLLDVVHALRTFKAGKVSSHGFVCFSENWPIVGRTTSYALEPGNGRGNNYTLSNEEAAAFPGFWTRFQLARSSPFLAAAIRRFGYAGERHRPEDSLVDLMIAAEALFLSDTDPRERGEMRFRLSLRFAWFVESESSSRRERFRHIRNAYDARSALVHGGVPDDNLLVLPGEGTVTLTKFIDATQEVLRVALRKAIEAAPQDRARLFDWNSVIFGCHESSCRP
jgi:hypothetical protein